MDSKIDRDKIACGASKKNLLTQQLRHDITLKNQCYDV